jgi:hypothetical protein
MLTDDAQITLGENRGVAVPDQPIRFWGEKGVVVVEVSRGGVPAHDRAGIANRGEDCARRAHGQKGTELWAGSTGQGNDGVAVFGVQRKAEFSLH